ncbi:PAS domain S-box protein [Natronobeatus ordinarius]|uniref:PAS domain S-box protein n=1 Tax=Natronobeatus ordinarius TaxID=2963433 RepID=UPI0020CD14FB|nr:PAS domain S-box protein [Natronobeatus ordinarius]
MDGSRGPTEPGDVLIVGDEPEAASAASSLATGDVSLAVAVETTIDDALERATTGDVDCLLWIEGSATGWADALERVRAHSPALPVVLLAEDGVDTAAAIAAGVTDVFEGPLEGHRATQLGRRLRGYAAAYRAERADEETWGGPQFRSIFEHSPNMISIHDEDGVIHNVNRRTCEKLGYDREELIGMNVAEVEVDHDPEELSTRWRSYEFGEPITVEGRNRRADGSEFPVRVSLGRIEVDGEELILAKLQDMSEEKARANELERYERIVENVPVGVFRLSLDPEVAFEFVNPAMVTMVGADSEGELLGRSPEEVCLEPDVRERLRARLFDDEEPLVSYEVRLQTLSGEPFWGAVTAIRTEADGERYVDSVVQDVTERKRAEQRRNESEAHLRQAQAVADISSWHYDVSSDTLKWSDDVYARLGIPVAEGRLDLERFFEYVHPDDLPRLEAEWASALEGDSYDLEYRVVVDGEPTWIRERAEATVDASGAVEGVVGILQDVTEWKAYEQRLEAQNEQLEVLNRIVRHDIRNHMNIVEGYAAELREGLEGRRTRMAERIVAAARELLSTSQKIREVDRLLADGPDRRPTDLAALVDDVLEECGERYPEGECTAAVPDGMWVEGSDALRFALENVIENGLEHNDAAEPRVAVTALERETDGVLEVRISDNGPGIPKAEYELLTGRRESTQVEHTSGLGLWAVNWIVTDIGGDLRFDVDEPRGTTAVLELPRVEAPEAS